MKQFLLPSDYSGETTFNISGKDYHYLKHVLRLRAGDKLRGIDRKGNPHLLTIERDVNESFILLLHPESLEAAPFPFSIDLYQCVPKGSRMDLVIRQATEIGVHRIVPLLSERTVMRVAGRDGAERKLARWIRIAKGALQQSGVRMMPAIDKPRSLVALEEREKGCDLFFHPAKPTDTNLHQLLAAPPRVVNLLIGPEGGFSENEIEYILGLGFSAVSLGDTVLRVETAALFAAAAVKILLLESKSWKTA
jgi:16S rRNA (uracil1498-N3)-methyltransferase